MILYISFVIIFCIFTVYATERRVARVGVGTEMLYGGNRRINTDTVNKAIIIIVLFTLWFFTAFRGVAIGNDTHTYLNYFYRINEVGFSDSFKVEYGFQALCLVIGLFTDNAQWLLIVCATICYAGVGAYILKYSKNGIVSVVLVFSLFFSSFTNILRQELAVVISLYAYQFIKDRKNFRALLLIVLAILFHRSAAVMLLLFFHKLCKFRINTVLIIACLLIILGVSGLAQTIAEKLAFEYSNYFNGKYARSGWLAVSVGVVRALVFYLFIYKAYRDNRKENSVMIANFAFLLLVCCLGYTVNLFTRAAEYFLLPAIVEIPNAFSTKKIKDGRLWLAVTVIVLLLYFLVTLIIRPEWNNLYPYAFFWD